MSDAQTHEQTRQNKLHIRLNGYWDIMFFSEKVDMVFDGDAWLPGGMEANITREK